MRTELRLIVLPEQAADINYLKTLVAEKLEVNESRINAILFIRKSIDARTSPVKINLALDVYLDSEYPEKEEIKFDYKQVENEKSVIVVGAGPAGLFAALQLIEIGLRPIILERGHDIRTRKVDVAQFVRKNSINTTSNYNFGEGGAGTFTDGKLFTRSKKKGDIRRIYEIFKYHGANDEILYESAPHLGSDKLPLIIESIRNTILSHGGEIHYEENVVDLLIENDTIQGCVTEKGNEYRSDALILATGHSNHHIYNMLFEKGIELEEKGFAVGVRVEHPQSLINKLQYHNDGENKHLPPASYSLVARVDDRSVYSFCMCPGGHILPAGTVDDSIVVNGMSTFSRSSPYANSGIVVEVHPDDIPEEFDKYGVLKGLEFQKYIENLAFRNNGGGGLVAPAQRLKDFVNNKLSVDLPACSYIPGVISSPIHFWLPEVIVKKLQVAFKEFDNKMKGYLTNDAIVVGVETRSSSPVRILRDNKSYQHIRIKGLFPTGEGSGYSGGITSSAVDGENVARKVAEYFEQIG